MRSAEQSAGLGAFIKVVEAGSFSAAARQLGTTPSAVSKSIAALEVRLGARLFRRSTRTLTLTAEGEAYYARIAPLLQQLEEAGDMLRGDVEAQGLLRLTMPTVLGGALIDPITSRFMAEHPAVRLEIGLTDRALDLVGEGYDLALRVGEVPDMGLHRRALAPLRLCLAASPAYLDRMGRPARRDELMAHRHIRYVTAGRAYPIRFDDGEDIWPDGVIDLDNGALMARAARNGTGVVQILEAAIRDELARGELERLLPGDPLYAPPVQLLHAYGRHVPHRARVFMDFLAREIERLAEATGGG